MAQQELTGGDGSTGQTGLGSRTVINENFTELYAAMLMVELGREWSAELLFDKHEISYDIKVMDADISFTLAASGHVSSVLSGAKQVIQADGVHALFFNESFAYLYGIVSGQILDAGTYQIYFLYDPSYGTVSVNIPGVTAESSIAVQLSAPSNFAAAADGETEIDLTWDDVTNESSYLIEWSLDGVSAWSTLSAPAAGATSANQTGLSAGDTRYYRIKAVGDGVAYLDSPYSTTSGTTVDAGDVTAPTFTFNPVSGVTTIAVNDPLVITADEELRNTDASPIVSDQAGIITTKQTNSGGSDIASTWAIDGTKKIITITPDTIWGDTQLVYWAINNVEDVSGNEVTVAQSSLVTSTDFTRFNGTSNFVIYGDTLDTLFTADNTNFELELTIKDYNGIGSQRLVGKYNESGAQLCFYLTTQGANIQFGYFGSNNFQRRIKWDNVLDSSEMTIRLAYDGSIDTNNGLDRASLYIDGVLITADKSLEIATGALVGTLKNVTAQLTVGSLTSPTGAPSGGYLNAQAKDFFVRSSSGSVVEISVPILRTGTDTSGNARNGTWA